MLFKVFQYFLKVSSDPPKKERERERERERRRRRRSSMFFFEQKNFLKIYSPIDILLI